MSQQTSMIGAPDITHVTALRTLAGGQFPDNHSECKDVGLLTAALAQKQLRCRLREHKRLTYAQQRLECLMRASCACSMLHCQRPMDRAASGKVAEDIL